MPSRFQRQKGFSAQETRRGDSYRATDDLGVRA